MVEVLRFQDHNQPTGLPPLTDTFDDWLARDHDVPAPVFLFVYPSHASTDPHRARWSVAWPVGGLTPAQMLAWRHVHADAYENEAGLETDPPRFVFAGAVTKTAGPGTVRAKRFLLGHLCLADRRKIESLAGETPVMPLDEARPDDLDGQGWIRDLLDRMVAAGIVSSEAREHAVQQASTGEWAW
ncbi:hypothetical protein BD413DRAFT_466871 [Trametes elegans]|nr:hypothetical protein BD413DRAFT_466871 [Trametes elegans]